MFINFVLNGDVSDDDDFDGFSEVVWMEFEDNLYFIDFLVVEGYILSWRKNKFMYECWLLSSSFWSFFLVLKFFRIVLMMVNRRYYINVIVLGFFVKKVFC